MRKHNKSSKPYRRITAIVILMISLTTSPASAEPQPTPPPSSPENATKLYTGSEVDSLIDILIDDISEASYEAIEQAAAEAAKAAILSLLDREATAYREAARQKTTAEQWRLEAAKHEQAVSLAKKIGIKNAIITGALCLASGFIVGIVTTNYR